MAFTEGIGQKFEPDAALAQWQRETFAANKERAAQHALAALQARIPVRKGKPRKGEQPGAMKAAAGVEVTNRGFVLYIDKYYAWWVEEGHKAGNRRTGRAKTLRSIAKEMRRVRKESGDESKKAEEDALRKEATRLNRRRKEDRRFVEGRKFIEQTLAQERDAIIAILSGKA